jgi:hypothetical protein
MRDDDTGAWQSRSQAQSLCLHRSAADACDCRDDDDDGTVDLIINQALTAIVAMTARYVIKRGNKLGNLSDQGFPEGREKRRWKTTSNH